MERSRAEALRWRLAQQENWRAAQAVRTGLQPPFDPHGHRLESFQAGLRIYRMEPGVEMVHGRPATVTTRMTKRLIDQAWHEHVAIESVLNVA
jgi:hypothetical protein